MSRFNDVFLIPLLMLVAVVVVQSRLIDISRDKDMIVQIHNDERSNTRPQAANMRDMTWDSRLQGQAEQWAQECDYARPPRNWNVGSNLYYHRHYLHGQGTVRRFIKDSMNAWIRQKDYYAYSSNCGSACLYVQMIHADVDRVGCAVSTCNNLRTRRHDSERATLLVCVYSPRLDLRNSFPYTEGRPCTRCPNGQYCVGGYRCSKGVASRLPDPYPADNDVAAFGERPNPRRNVRQPWQPRQPRQPRQPNFGRNARQLIADSMTAEEMRSMLDLHNDFRRENGLSPLSWDKYLERWSNHVINCSVDYPGPVSTYTNFHRFNSNDRLTSALYDWKARGNEKPPRMEHKCRTPDDKEQCSHYSNLMNSRVTTMACSTKACSGYTRQMVCIYDNKPDRDYRLSELRRVRRPARRWRDDNERYTDARNYRRRDDYRRRRTRF